MAPIITPDQLASYCNWGALPRELLLSVLAQQPRQRGGCRGGTQPHAAAGDDTAQSGTEDLHHESDAALLQRFLQHVASSVPQEWHVRCQRVFAQCDGLGSGNGIRPTVHGRAVSTPTGIMVFGGLQAGQLQHVRPQHEVSWVHNAQPGGLQPDCSTLLQAVPSQPSRQVVRVQPSSSNSSSWGATPCSPALSAGLIGHSAVLFGSRAYIFGGMHTGAAAAGAVADDRGRDADSSSKPRQQCCNSLAAYAVDAAGTQDGLLPVLSEPLPQFGAVPSARMHHSAAIDADNGVMWVYGGVREGLNGARQPADNEPGLLHAFNLSTYTWQRVATKGTQRPCSTTLLAFFFHDGALWAIPDLPQHQQQQQRRGGSSSSSSKRAAVPSHYQLFRLDTTSYEWSLVVAQGDGPSQRVEACAVWVPESAELIVHGGRTTATPSAVLSDVHVLALHTAPPAWTLVRPRLLTTPAAAGGSSSTRQQHQQGAASAPALAGHAGSVMGCSSSGGGGGDSAHSSRALLFVGGYSRTDDKQGQSQLLVLTRGVKPPTPEAAKLGTAASQQQLARQHVRLAVARLVKGALPKQVHLAASDGGGVRLPARLLALYSSLFDDLFQGLLEGDEEQEADSAPAAAGLGGAAAAPAAAAHVPIVPVPGVSADSVAAVCRWMMGLLTLASCAVSRLVDMYSVADRLVVEALQLEVLEELRGRQLAPHEAVAVMAFAGRLQDGVGEEGGMAEAGASAEQQLRSAITPATAPDIMALAQQCRHHQLQARCIEVMQGARKNDPWSVMAFALRFRHAQLQGSCLRQLRLASRGELLACVDRLLRLAGQHVEAVGGAAGSSGGLANSSAGGSCLGSARQYASLADVPLVRMLESDLVQEAEEAGLAGVLPYIGCADRLQLPRVARGLASYLSRPGVWQELHGAPAHAHVLQTLQARHGPMYAACRARSAQGGGRWVA